MSGETDLEPSGWTPDLLFLHLKTSMENHDRLFQAQMLALTKMLDERYETQAKAIDVAFVSQQTAMTVAFSAAEKAVNAAILAAKEAVEKANTANEKRFEAVNEFRGQLNDVMTTLISRGEADARFTAIDEKVSSIQRTLDKGGGKEAWGYLVGAVGLVAVIVTMAIQLIGH